MTHQSTRSHRGDDYAIWPDGTWTTLDEIRRGDWTWMSDGYEVVPAENTDRRRELGIDLEEPG